MGITAMSSNQSINTEKEIQCALDTIQFATLATQSDGQPHASLMAFAPMKGLRHLIVATYRNTLKYRNLISDGRVAMLIDNREESGSKDHRTLVLTAHGIASEVPSCDYKAVEQAYLARHSNLGTFLASPECVLLRIAVSAYEVVGSTDDVLWYKVDDDVVTN